jgi:hypothetical protein
MAHPISTSSPGWASLFLPTIVVLAGCGPQEGVTDTDCPNYTVSPDAAITGFSSVGEWRTDAVCTQYCTADFPVCQLATATSVKCQKGCG